MKLLRKILEDHFHDIVVTKREDKEVDQREEEEIEHVDDESFNLSDLDCKCSPICVI